MTRIEIQRLAKIRKLEKEVDRLYKALEPFAPFTDYPSDEMVIQRGIASDAVYLWGKDIKRAAKAFVK
jgi:tetrahydromethanopterin S-methyltransferase subunit B